MAAVLDHAREGGSFRHLVYERLGLSVAAYAPLCMGAGMDVSNELVCGGGRMPDDVTDALKVIEDHAQAQPMEPSVHKRTDGTVIDFASADRIKWFNVLYTLKAVVERPTTQTLAYDKIRAELAEQVRQTSDVQSVPPSE